MTLLRTVSPVDGRILVERELAGEAAVAAALERAGQAFRHWRATPLTERLTLIGRAVDALVARGSELAAEITWQMGRPIGQSPGEIRGLEERACYMLAAAPRALADRLAQPAAGIGEPMVDVEVKGHRGHVNTRLRRTQAGLMR